MNRALSILLLILMIVGAVRREMLAALLPSWRTSRPAGPPGSLSRWPLRFVRDPMPRDLVAFLERVEGVTSPGTNIAVLLPPPWNAEDASYARFRTYYLLAGHRIGFPLDANSRVYERVQYVAAWHSAIAPPAGPVVLATEGGVLTRRAVR